MLIVGAASLVVLVLVSTQVLAFVSLVVQRLSRDAAYEAARRRDEPTALAAVRMPDFGDNRVEWGKLLPLGDGVLALGVSEGAGAVVSLVLDASGSARALEKLDRCTQADAVAVGPRHVLVLCAAADGARFIGVTFDDGRLEARAIAGEGVPLRCDRGCVLMSAVRGERYAWLLPQHGGHRVIATGRGLAAPEMADVRGLSTFVTGVVPVGEDGAVAVTHTDKVTDLKLSIITPEGKVAESVTVASAPADFPGVGRAQVLSDGQEVAVFWTRVQEGRWPNDSKNTTLVERRFGRRLAPVGGARGVGDDPFVISFRAYGWANGGMVAWDQGFRDSWETGSFVAFPALSGITHRAPRRTPFGRLPISAAQVGNRTFMLMPASSSITPAFETIIVDS